MKFNRFFPAFLFLPLVLGAQTGPENLSVSSAPLWERDIGAAVQGIPFLQAESVVVICETGQIKSWGMSGAALWEYDSRGRLGPHTSRSQEAATYVGDTSGAFIALNRVGRELWRMSLGKPMSHPPVIGWDGRIFITAGSEIFCRTAAGFPLWSMDLGSPAAVPPVLDHAGGIAAFLENRTFIRISHTGVLEKLSLDRLPALALPLLGGGNTPEVSGGGNSFLLLYQNGDTENIKLDFGKPQGTALSRTRLTALPGTPVAAAAWGEQAAVTLKDGRVLALSGMSGGVQWVGNSHETAMEKGSGNLAAGDINMVYDERGIFSMSRRGATAFAVDGRRRWLFRIPESSIVPVLSGEGLLYVCGRDRMLRAYKADNQVRNIPRSIYGPDPEGSYGLGNPPPSSWSSAADRFEEAVVKKIYEEIYKASMEGQVGEKEPDYVAYLMEMIGYFLNAPNRTLVRAPVKTPERINFIRLLARMGSRETIRFLVTIYNRDPEPSIKAACCEAIGKIGVDPKGEAIQAYRFLLSRDNANFDSQILLSASDSIMALCLFSGPPLAADGIGLLSLIARFPDFRPDVKKRAQDHLNALRRQSQ